MSTLSAEHLTLTLNGADIIRDVSCSVSTGEIVGLVGPNGAGKSTLMRGMCRLLRPTSGRVALDSHTLEQVPRRDLARRVSYLPQGNALHWRLDVSHLVALGRMPHQGPFAGISETDAHAIVAAMDRAEVTPFADREVGTLSGGERARAMLARVLAVEAEFILADEPAAALDPYHALHVMELLRELAREGRGVLVVLHDLSLAMRFCDRLVMLDNGEVARAGTPADVLALESLGRSYGVRAHYGVHEDEGFVVPWRRLPRRQDGA